MPFCFIPCENASVLILITLSGISIDFKLLQPLNVEIPIVLTLFGIVTDVSPVQLENTASSIFV